MREYSKNSNEFITQKGKCKRFMFDLLHVMQKDGYLTATELVAIRKTCKELGENPVRLLRSLNIASPEQIQEYLQKHFKALVLRDEAIESLDENFQIFVPIDIAIFYSCFGIGEENGTTYIAIEDPSDRGQLNQLKFLLGKKVVGVCATVFQLAEGLTKIYNIPISSLKLTTAIEKSRGVIGGIRYQESYVDSVEINDSFAGLNLEDEENHSSEDTQTTQINDNHPFADLTKETLENLYTEIENQENRKNLDSFLEEATHINEPPPLLNFIDGSNGEIDPKLLQVDQATENFNDIFAASKNHENPMEDGENSQNEVIEQTKQKLLQQINFLLTKTAFTKDKEKALEIVNQTLEPLKIFIDIENEDDLLFNWKKNTLKIPLSQLDNQIHPLVKALIPLIKKLAKLK